ncbi:alpha/beta-hydrolase [Clavulina sp. PMI_390]|nr:alpha/beta-hydrolase [Clavulina sp. PMI_390]
MLAATLLAGLSITSAHAALLGPVQLPLLPWLRPNAPTPSPPASHMTFRLRHLHAVHPETHSNLFKDVDHEVSSFASEPSLSLRTSRVSVHRPRSQSAFHEARTSSRLWGHSSLIDWDEDEIEGPDVTDRETLLLLAKMTNDAYLSPGESGWYDLGDQWNTSYPFGWEPDADGFRGHIFATEDNSTVILSIKGTSAGIVGGGGPTSKKDKLNDNLLWSCCCARVDWTWTTVCGCYSGPNKCDANCLEDAMTEESLFYPVGTNLYNNVSYLYPNSNIWVTGHSLGGGLASLIGATFGVPVVAYESPGEVLAAKRLHLPTPPALTHITHVYHNADPVPLGACTGATSTCYYGGFALETRCHLGKSIIYDTVNGEGYKWAVDIRTHGIKTIIDSILSKNGSVPVAEPEDDCVECYQWEFGDFKNGTKKATSANGLIDRTSNPSCSGL